MRLAAQAGTFDLCRMPLVHLPPLLLWRLVLIHFYGLFSDGQRVVMQVRQRSSRLPAEDSIDQLVSPILARGRFLYILIALVKFHLHFLARAAVLRRRRWVTVLLLDLSEL